MDKELASDGVSGNRQRIVAVIYKGENIGEYRLDMVAEEGALPEFESVSEMNEILESHVLSSRRASGLKLDLRINFGGKKVEVRGIVN